MAKNLIIPVISMDTKNVSSLAKGATAQLREIADKADREVARQLHAELVKLAKFLGHKYGFRISKPKA